MSKVENKSEKIIASTAGTDMGLLHKVYSLFKSNQRDFAFMHCVGDYLTQWTPP